MKTFLSSFFLVSLITISLSCYGNVVNDSLGDLTSQVDENTLQIVSSPELSKLTSNWIAGFCELHPELQITIQPLVEGSALKPGDIYLLNSNQQSNVPVATSWQMVVAHDIIVPIFNANNLLFAEIYKSGIPSENFAMMLSQNADWSKLVVGTPFQPIHTFITDDQQVFSRLSCFTSTDESAIHAKKAASAKELIAAVQNDQYAIGFCKLAEVIKPGTNTFADQIRIVPIDKNRNGRLDGFENIYKDPNQLTRGAWLGKYPIELRSDAYAITTSEPSNQAALAFLTWLNKDGQNHLENSGFVILSSRERKDNLLTLAQPVANSNPIDSPLIPIGWKLVIGMAVILLFVILVFSRHKQEINVESEDIVTTSALNERSVLAPAGLYYSKSHTWAYREPDGMVIVGIDDFMQHLTGSLTQVKMKSSGDKVCKGDKIVSLIREGKQLELYSPVTGTISLQNQRLQNKPADINSAPYNDGWIYLIEPTNWHREIRFLFTVEKYREWLEDEFVRLKDFLATIANANNTVFNHLILQDGGELTDNVLADLDPEIWEDFQTQFIDKGR